MKQLQGENFGAEVAEERRYLPSFSITGEDLPEVKKWEVGKTYELKIKVRMKSLTEQEKKTRAELEIQGVEIAKKKNYEKEYAEKRSNINS